MRTTRLLVCGATCALLGACDAGTEGVLPLGAVAADEVSATADRFSDWSEPVNLGPVVNSGSVDFTPALAPDGLSLYFASNRPGGFGATDLYVTRRAGPDQPWGPPVNLGGVINTSSTEGAPAFSRDGHHLYFASGRPGGFGSNDIWVSWRADTDDDLAWDPPMNVGPGVNDVSFDAGAALWRPEFYFTSDRATGGPLDVYISRATGGTLGPATLVAELSSAGNDLRPTIRFDGRELFLSSDRAGSAGGSQDIWVAMRPAAGKPWIVPVNLGSAVNTEYSEQQPGLSADGLTLLFASDRPGGSGGVDLYMTTREIQRQ